MACYFTYKILKIEKYRGYGISILFITTFSLLFVCVFSVYLCSKQILIHYKGDSYTASIVRIKKIESVDKTKDINKRNVYSESVVYRKWVEFIDKNNVRRVMQTDIETSDVPIVGSKMQIIFLEGKKWVTEKSFTQYLFVLLLFLVFVNTALVIYKLFTITHNIYFLNFRNVVRRMLLSSLVLLFSIVVICFLYIRFFYNTIDILIGFILCLLISVIVTMFFDRLINQSLNDKYVKKNNNIEFSKRD
ncbi:hypothetical protein [Flavobacterium hankyongi]|uniref:hypothetical protein n=1 Tax=Flavobacterium hankyongi TaxID=1176532 RepID=UPI0030D1865B